MYKENQKAHSKTAYGTSKKTPIFTPSGKKGDSRPPGANKCNMEKPCKDGAGIKWDPKALGLQRNGYDGVAMTRKFDYKPKKPVGAVRKPMPEGGGSPLRPEPKKAPAAPAPPPPPAPEAAADAPAPAQ